MSSKIAVVFPGQGSQAVGMGKDLAEKFSTAKEVFNRVDEILGLKLSNIMFEGPEADLTKTENAQPALMAVSVALVEVLRRDFGKEFSSICGFTAGHSLGEYSALCASSALSLEDTAKLLQIRGREMAACGAKTEGLMAAILGVEIELAEKIAAEAAQDEVCQVANDNSVGQIVISGSKTAILRAIEIAKTMGAKRALALPVSGAFHSSLMNQAQNQMQEALKAVQINEPKVKFVANICADFVSDSSQIRQNLVSQITGSVRWRETMLLLEKSGVEEIIEIGSGKVLSGLAMRTCPNIKTRNLQNSADLIEFLKYTKAP